MDDAAKKGADIIGLASEIVSAYGLKNNVPASMLPGLVAATHAKLVRLCAPPARNGRPVPVVPIQATVTPDHLISLEDGKPYKTLKRHLTARGLTPDEYRRKWGLPPDYPMVAANYAAERFKSAKSTGFGMNRRLPVAARKAKVGA